MKKFLKIPASILATVVCAFSFLACASDGLAPHRDAKGTVSKKGLCVSRYNDGTESSAEKVKSLNPSWYYTWGVKTENEYIDAEFVPMVWGRWHVTQENLDYIKENYESGKFTHLLTFNEPDLPDQANMSVDEALSYWEQLEEIGIPLSSPVVSWYNRKEDNPNAGNPWLDEFMEKAEERGLRVDFIAVHSYQPFYLDGMVESFKTDTLDLLYEKYGLPIWVTEFGAIDTIAREQGRGELTKGCTEESAVKFIREACAMLEGCEYVERYSWFVDNMKDRGDDRPFEAVYTALFNDDDTIAKTGEAYAAVKSKVPLKFEIFDLQPATANKAYSQYVYVCGGTGDYTFTSSGLPSGLTMSKAGRISGKPKEQGVYDVTVTVTDSAPAEIIQTITYNYKLTVN